MSQLQSKIFVLRVLFSSFPSAFESKLSTLPETKKGALWGRLLHLSAESEGLTALIPFIPESHYKSQLRVLFSSFPSAFESKHSTLPETKKGALWGRLLHLSAERTLPISNLKSLNSLETKRLVKIISPHQIITAKDETANKTLNRDLIAIKEFLNFVEAEPFITSEKAKIIKRVAFKKLKSE